MPAAAVIPAPIGYIKVVAVEKLVVEVCRVARVETLVRLEIWGPTGGVGFTPSPVRPSVTESKMECSKQAFGFEHISLE